MSWAATKNADEESAASYGVEYYRSLFTKPRSITSRMRTALVGRENTAKTGLSCWLARTEEDIAGGKKVIVVDCDKSAMETISHVVEDPENFLIYTMDDAADDSIFKPDGVTVDYHALVKKVKTFGNIIAEEIQENGDEYAAVIFDGGSTFMKWCEFAMRESLMKRGIISDEGDNFNQKEWRERNMLFRDTINRFHTLDIDRVFFTFHMKELSSYVNGERVKTGEKIDWVDGTQRIVSQQIFLRRFTKKGDVAAGVEKDTDLGEDDFVIRGIIEEIKGRGMEHVGTEHDVLVVSNGEVTWNGLPPLRW